MSVPFPPLPSYLPADLPPLGPLPQDITKLVHRAQEAANARGEKPGPAGSAERRQLEALTQARAEAAQATPVPAPDGVWMVASDAGSGEVWWAVRPLGGGRAEVWGGRVAPVTVRVRDLRPRPVRRSRLQVRIDEDAPRTFRVGIDRGTLSDVGLPATPWWRTGGGDDPIAAVVLLVAASGVLVTLPWRLAKARRRASTRNALVAALRA